MTYVQEMNLGFVRERKLTVSETSVFKKQPAACSGVKLVQNIRMMSVLDNEW